MRRYGILVRLIMVIASLLLLAAPVRAQSGINGEVLSVGLGGVGDQYGRYRVGNWVPVHVRLENRTGQQMSCYVGVDQPDLDGDKVTCLSNKIIFSPNIEPKDVWLYYWPRPNDDGRGIQSLSIYDATNMHVISTIKAPKPLPQEDPGIMPDGGADNRSARWVLVLGQKRLGFNYYIGSRGGVSRIVSTSITQATDLPEQALGLDGVDAIVWQADQPGVRVSDFPSEEFQIKAILDWVRAGGHLIITVGTHWQELGDPKTKLSEALPMIFEGTRQDSAAGLLEYLAVRIQGGADNVVQQVTGKVRPGARDISIPLGGDDSRHENPLVVTGTYGAGAVTLVTIDMARPEIESMMSPENWLSFWQTVAGWSGRVYSAAQIEQMTKNDNYTPPSSYSRAMLDKGISAEVDLVSVTSWRLLLAVLFLGAYWIVAGPGMDVLLRRYHRPHWSWWFFGAVVMAAVVMAVLFASLLRLEREDMRHRTFVAGTVGDSHATVLSYMGVFAPTNSHVPLGLPEGIGYLAPLNEPAFQDVQTFADPQSYFLPIDPQNEQLSIPFRSTLKKLQARWTGQIADGFEGSGVTIRKIRDASEIATKLQIEGTLINRTRYEFTDVKLVAVSDDPRDYISPSTVFDLPENATWRPGQPLVLERDTIRRKPELKTYLKAAGQKIATRGAGIPEIVQNKNDAEKVDVKLPEELLATLLDMREGEPFNDPAGRVEFVRQLTRQADRSAALRAARLMLIAHAGSTGQGVVSPLALRVGDKTLRGSGQVTYAYVIPLK